MRYTQRMRKASIADAQHHLSRILMYVDQGEEVLLTRRNRVVAKIVPTCTNAPQLPKFSQRAREIFGEPNGAMISELIAEDREERR